MTIPSETLERTFDRLLAAARTRPSIAAEFDESHFVFFAQAISSGTPRGDAARRYSEWFLLERFSDGLEDVPVRGLAADLAGSGPDVEGALRALAASFVGVFAITSVAAGEGVWVRDLVGLGEYPLAEAEGSLALREGDVLVGRLVPVGDTLYRVSPAAGVFRTPGLVEALEADLDRARTGHRGVLRLSQLELESMFFSSSTTGDQDRPEGAGAGDPRGRAFAELVAAGLDRDTAEQALEELSRVPFEGERLVHGVPGDVLGGLLERIAFETDADIERVRRVFLRVWPTLAPPLTTTTTPEAPVPSGSGDTVDTKAALAAFDRGRSAGRDLDELFGQLERDLRLESDDGDDGGDDDVPDFPGVVGAMVDEFLWEVEREQGEVMAARYRSLEAFARYGASYGVFENLGQRDLILFLAVWLPEQRPRVEEALDVLEALHAFCTWAEKNHDVLLDSALGELWQELRGDLGRVIAANEHLESMGDPTSVQLVEYLGDGRARAGDGPDLSVQAPADTLAQLEPGDRLRVTGGDGDALRVLCCYPPQSARLGLEARATSSS